MEAGACAATDVGVDGVAVEVEEAWFCVIGRLRLPTGVPDSAALMITRLVVGGAILLNRFVL